MTIRFYGLKTCDTCKKAQKALEAAGVDFRAIDVRADGVAAENLADWIARVGADALVNRRSTTWRGLDDAARAGAETPDGAAALLLANPTLMKRPVIVSGDDIHVGWTKEAQAALL